MNDRITSTIAFKSNLQPVNGSIKEDKRFLAKVHDPFALEIMKKTGVNWVTEIQAKEFQSASMHCAYAFPGDYPFGTVIDNSGKPCVVCKCINTDCIHFSQCRPDFDDSELIVSEENVSFQKAVREILEEFSGSKEVDEEVADKGDAEAVNVLFSGQTDTRNKSEDETDETRDYSDEELDETKDEQQERSETHEQPENEQIPPVTFASFEEVRQDDIIRLNETERTIVNAGPGTGKTWTLIEKIKYMLSELEIEPENILVLCFSRAAVEVIRNRLEKAAAQDELPMNWHEIDVRTFDSFATYFLAWLQENEEDLLPEGFSLEFANYNQRVEAAVSAIEKFADMFAEYQHVIVDEVQDLVGIRARMVLAILKNLPDTCGFTILGDSCQALYDYLAETDASVMDSAHFYQEIFETYRMANYYALTHNYRQGNEFGTLTIQYRNTILTGTSEERAKEAKEILTNISDSEVNLKHFSQSDVTKYQRIGTLGVLTRTNGQALQISSWLRAEGILHTLQRPLGSKELGSWIMRVLTQAETDVIDFSEFNEIFSSIYPLKASFADRYWSALISTQRDETKRHYEIEDFLRGLIQNARNPLLFEEPENQNYNITVSNIHRAKGREFDAVLVLDDVLEAMADEENDDILEHKVCYVALTRPKKQIEKVNLKTQYIYISRDEDRRCFKAGGRPGHNYLSHFEVGYGTDIDERSFAATPEIQKYIRELPVDSRLMLLRCKEDTAHYVVYKLVPEEDDRMILGYTTPSFARNVEKAIQRIYKNNCPVSYKYYPEIFNDIYLEGLYTCVSANGDAVEGATQIGDMFIWYGLEISGFAHRESTRY